MQISQRKQQRENLHLWNFPFYSKTSSYLILKLDKTHTLQDEIRLSKFPFTVKGLHSQKQIILRSITNMFNRFIYEVMTRN